MWMMCLSWGPALYGIFRFFFRKSIGLSIKLIIETEQNANLSFPDILINQSSIHFTFSVYGRLLKENTVITFCANVPFKYKINLLSDVLMNYVQMIN